MTFTTSNGDNTPGDLILLVEDEAHLAEALLFNLRAEGYRTHHAPDGETALDYLLHSGPHADPSPAAVLLDVMLPGIEGFDVARQLRAAGNYVPILMLTARGRPEDVLEGFSAGADDYLPKPFELSILLARLGSLLRRMQWHAPAPTDAGVAANSSETARTPSPQTQATETQATEPPALQDTYHFGNREVRFDTLEILAPGQTIRLTLMEAELLRYLIQRAGKIVSRREILEEVWRVREDTDTRAIDNFVVRLRRYLEPDPVHPTHLLTVRGIGYRFLTEGTWT